MGNLVLCGSPRFFMNVGSKGKALSTLKEEVA